MSDTTAGPVGASPPSAADNPQPRFWDWFTGNANYPEWSRLGDAGIAAMYCAWAAGQDALRPPRADAPCEDGEDAAVRDVLAKADHAARWCHGMVEMRTLFPDLWHDLANLETALGELDVVRAAGRARAREGDGQMTALPCTAIIGCGPGHQSRADCERRGEHTVHYAPYGAQNAPTYWLGERATSTFFDESPFEDDEAALRYAARAEARAEEG